MNSGSEVRSCGRSIRACRLSGKKKIEGEVVKRNEGVRKSKCIDVLTIEGTPKKLDSDREVDVIYCSEVLGEEELEIDVLH